MTKCNVSDDSKILNRFTSLPVLVDLLRRKKLVLTDPLSWEDKNDVELIKKYEVSRTGQKIFVICFCTESESIHFWKSYANGESGCCVEFNRKMLLDSIKNTNQYKDGKIVPGKVQYRTIEYIKRRTKKNNLRIEDYPFTKRQPYGIEEEFRILCWGLPSDQTIELDICLESINKITLSQLMPRDLFESTREHLVEILDNRQKKDLIVQSTIYRNEDWIAKF